MCNFEKIDRIYYSNIRQSIPFRNLIKKKKNIIFISFPVKIIIYNFKDCVVYNY